MDFDLIAILWGVGAAAITTLALYLLWVRPTVTSARKTVEEAELLKRRLQGEAELAAGSAMLEAKEEALKLREKLEDEIRQEKAALARLDEKLSLKDDALEARRTQIADREELLAQQQKALGDRT